MDGHTQSKSVRKIKKHFHSHREKKRTFKGEDGEERVEPLIKHEINIEKQKCDAARLERRGAGNLINP